VFFNFSFLRQALSTRKEYHVFCRVFKGIFDMFLEKQRFFIVFIRQTGHAPKKMRAISHFLGYSFYFMSIGCNFGYGFVCTKKVA